MKHFLTLFLALAVLMGCRKDPDLLDPILVETINLNDVYGTRMASVSLGADYRQQAYFSLVDNRWVATHDKYDWEVAMTHDDTAKLLLNHAIPGLRVAVGPADWTEWVDEFALTWRYDLPGGEGTDMLAIGADWAGQTLVLDRGLDPAGEHRGYRKFRFEANGDGLVLRVAELSGDNEATFTWPRDPNHHQTEWHLDLGPAQLSPPRDTWDLLFTNYLHVYEPDDAPFPYQVTGALLAADGRRAVRFDETPFDTFTAPDNLNDLLSERRDAVGFDWKTYDFDLGYVMTPDLTFVVDSDDNGSFALSFTSFTDENGERGAPEFAFRRLP